MQKPNQILYTFTMKTRKLEIQNGGQWGVKNGNYKPLNLPEPNFLHLICGSLEY